MNTRIIFHIDVNSAYLSWEAVYRLQHDDTRDLREIPSVIGGNEESRHGIVLAKSIPAKKFNIQTGETLMSARGKCPGLCVVPPRYSLYMQCSNAMMDILREYTPAIQRFSVDENFLDFTGMENLYPDFLDLANTIKERIKNELGFTVNIGISSNKLLAKMASDLKKPDRIHTLFPSEIQKKMWPLPVSDLFMVGRATLVKLNKLNIFTIGDLAKYDPDILKSILKSHGKLIWNYANGLENSDVRANNRIEMKGIGNSTTIPFDVRDADTARKILLSLSETVGIRLRNSKNLCSLVSVSIRTNEFMNCSRQRKLYIPTDSTKDISEEAYRLFDSCWKGEPIRHMGVSVRELCTNELFQLSLFGEKASLKSRDLDKAMDEIRCKFGSKSIVRGVFVNSGFKPLSGGVDEEDYPMMTSIL